MPFDDLTRRSRAQAWRRRAFVVEPIQGEGGARTPRRATCAKRSRPVARRERSSSSTRCRRGWGAPGNVRLRARGRSSPTRVPGEGAGRRHGAGGGDGGARRGVPEGLRHDATCQLHGTTSAGSLAMAAVLATLAALSEEKLVEKRRSRALPQGPPARPRAAAPIVREVRGRGLLLALKFEDAPRDPHRNLFSKLGRPPRRSVQHVALAADEEHRIVAQSA